MSKQELKYIKQKFILYMSLMLILVASGLLATTALTVDTNFEIASFDVSQIATSTATRKKGAQENKGKLIEVNNEQKSNKILEEEVKVTPVTVEEEVEEQPQTPARIWYLPTEMGRVTQSPSSSHAAYDITSSRGTAETIYPIASGIISGIYTDYAGALIVTVRHIVDGKYYTSLYAHLSSYANISVGQEVTPFTPLGQMGTTGNSTGVHLHIVVTDCNMFGNTDSCSDLNGFFNFAKQRQREGSLGLGSLIYVPGYWTSR